MGKRGPLKRGSASHGGKVPTMPGHLQDAGRKLWRRVIEGLRERKAIGTLHANSLVDLCDLADEIDALKENVRREGHTYESCNGSQCERPESKMLDRKRRLFAEYAKRFGLTPADDARLNGAPEPEKEEDTLDVLKNLGAMRN